MCLLCALAHNPFRAAAAVAASYFLIDHHALAWLAVFAASMSFMDHRRDFLPGNVPSTVATGEPSAATGGSVAQQMVAQQPSVTVYFTPGDSVLLHGLIGRSDMNGQLAIVNDWPNADGRQPVVVDIDGSQQEAYLKPSNLSAAKVPPDWYSPAPPQCPCGRMDVHARARLCEPCES